MGAFDSVTKKISSLVGITSKGQATAANSLPVTLPSDQGTLGTAETQAGGWQDDRSESGYLRTRLARGEIVPIPFRTGHYQVEGAGWARNELAFNDSEAGYGSGFQAVLSALSTSGSRIIFPFYGPILGLQYRHLAASMLDRLSVVVDGESFGLAVYPPFLTSRALTATSDGWSSGIVVSDLPDLPNGAPHIGEICVCSHPTTASGTISILNYLVDRQAGYERQPRYMWTESTLLTASAAALYKGGTTAQTARYIRRVVFLNTDVATRTVTLELAGTTVDILSLTAAGTAGARWEYDFGKEYNGAMTAKADVTSVVRCTLHVG